MTFKYKIKIEISFVTTAQLICVFVFIVWKVQGGMYSDRYTGPQMLER